MSRFFATTAYDSSSSSDEESLLSSDEEPLLSSSDEEEVSQELSPESEEEEEEDDFDEESEDWGPDSDEDSDSSEGEVRDRSYFLKKDFLKGSGSDSDSEDEKKVVKSAKEKYLEEVAQVVDQVENQSMVRDWVVLAELWDQLQKLVNKYPQHHIPIPREFIKSLAVVDEAVREFQDEQKSSGQKLNSSTSKALNVIRQRVKKAIREYDTEVDQYRSNPDTFLASDGSVPVSALGSKDATPAPQKEEPEEVTLFNALREILDSRGKRNVDQKEQLESLDKYLSVPRTPYELISIYLIQISIRFDLFSKSMFMPPEQWKLSLQDTEKLLGVLDANPQYIVTETAPIPDDIAAEPKPDANGNIQIVGSLASIVERLSDELTSHLLVIDPHSTEYIVYLRDEAPLYRVILRSQLYFERIVPVQERNLPQGSQLARVVLKRLESVYYKPTKLIVFGEVKAWSAAGANANSAIYPRLDNDKGLQGLEYTNGLIDSLCSVLYKQENSVFRKRAVLCHIYYYALNDQYYKSRDMMLLSHLQSTIHTAEPQLQIMFNRALVQLGLSAFRKGLIHETQQLLQEIVTSPRQKELLGQGVQRYQQQQSQAEKQRLLPFHMHINLELLECSFYTASLLIEVPLMAQYPDYARRRQSSPKAFRRVLEYRERQVFDGPPENARDHIMLAARALGNYDWKLAAKLLNSIEIWNLFSNIDDVKERILARLQLEALRTFIFKNRPHFSKCALSQLSALFELPEPKVRAILSKMIHNDDISASINLSANSLEFFKDNSKPNKLEEAVLTLSDKCYQIIERNDKLSTGGYQIQVDPKKLTSKRK